MTRILKAIGRLTRWFFGSPFQELPPEFGDPVPSDLRLFEAKTAAVQYQPQGRLRVRSAGSKNSNQTRSSE